MKKLFLLLLALIATTSVLAEDYITDIMVIGGSKSETNALKASYTEQGWTVIDQDLNAGAGGDYIFLLYKKASEVNATYGTFIKDIYISSDSGTAPDYIVHNRRPYELVPYDGSDYFKSSKGDLNCHCSGSDYIHLYYTIRYPGVDNGQDYTTVKSIYFNSTQAGAVGENGGTTGYDLNSGAGGDYIYMHTDKSQGWTFTKNSDGTQCYINGFDGPKTTLAFTRIPTTLDGAQVANFVGSVFSGFTNLEEIIFYENTIISQMPLMQGCSKFKHVTTGNNNFDQTPSSMTNIPAFAFAGTAINTINMPSVTNIGEHAFEGSGLKQITLQPCLMEIGSCAFQNCNALTDIYFDGTQQQWSNVTKGANWKPDATKEHWRCIVTFDANGHGVAPEAQTVWSNQDKATEPTPPTAALYVFQGWFTEAECTHQWNFNTVVNSDITLYAKWYPQYTFDSETGELALLWGEFNKDNKWGDDVPASAVKRVIANSGVSFTGDCTELFSAFAQCESMDLSKVNTDSVTNMSGMFYGCSSLTSLDLSGWNTANVTDMSWMFYNCNDMTSLDLLGWDTGNVTDMMRMFLDCSNLTTICVDLGWRTENVTSSTEMFKNCTAIVGYMGTTYDENHIDKEYARIDGGPECPGYFNTGGPRYTFNSESGTLQLLWGEFNKDNKWGDDVPASKVKSVTATRYVSFTGDCSMLFRAFGQCWCMDLSKVNTRNATNMSNMFLSCTSLTNLNVSGWDTGNVIDMNRMFFDCWILPSLDLTGWNTSNVTNMEYMFCNCMNLNTIYVSQMWSTENVIYSYCMFDDCTAIVGGMGTTYDRNHIDKEYARIDGGPDCPGYFTSVMPRYTYNSTTGALALNWGVFNRTDKWGEDVPIEEVKSVTATRAVSFTGDCTELFYNFTTCTSMDLNSVNTSNLTNMTFMFLECHNLTTLNISDWNTSNVTTMQNAFSACRNLTTLNISDWNTSNVTMMLGMFENCSNLTTIYVGQQWSTENVYGTASSGMFRNNYALIGGMGTTFDPNHINKEYARIDGGPDCPGYFTDPNATVVVTGDVDGDGYVTTVDITAIYNYLLNGDETYLSTSDIDGDGFITTTDITVIYNILLGNKK